MPTIIPHNGETKIARIRIRKNAYVAKVIVKERPQQSVQLEDRQQAVIQSTNLTKVRQVMVGRPVRRVTATSGVGIDNISGIDVSAGKEDGDVLVYSSSSSNFEPTRKLEKQFINGGHY